jgi:hypothetical protein
VGDRDGSTLRAASEASVTRNPLDQGTKDAVITALICLGMALALLKVIVSGKIAMKGLYHVLRKLRK